MPLLDNIELELYVATNKFPNKQQYEESQLVLRIIKQNGVKDRIKITCLDDLRDEDDIFSTIANKESERRLPYLECIHLGVGVYSDYIGLSEIIEKFKELGLSWK